MTTKVKEPEVVLIGAGPGGYTSAIRLGQYGYEPVIIEKESVGGVCLNWGCIPTKTLYSTTDPLGKVDSWEKRGIKCENLNIDLEKIIAHQRQVVGTLTGGVTKLIEDNGGKIIKGKARLSPGPKVDVRTDQDENLTYEPSKVILATGSVPIELPDFPFSHPDIWDSRDALEPETVPENLVILGAGVIGLEMATIYSRLGSKVRILEMEDKILPGMDLDRRFQAYLSRSLKSDGITVETNTKAVELKDKKGKQLVVARKTTKDKLVEHEADKILVAVGRYPLVDCISDDLLSQMRRNKDGKDNLNYLPTDQAMKTNVDDVYAIGDLAGSPFLAHKASREGLTASASIAGEETSSPRAIPAVVFSDPEYAQVGMSETEARNQETETLIGRFPLRASGKALSMDESEGIVQLVIDADSDVILGGSVLSVNASELIGEIGLAVEAELKASEVAQTVHAHPTLSEAIMEAAENAHGRAIHTGNK